MPAPLYPDFRPDREPFTGLNRLTADVEALRNAQGAGDLGVSNEGGGLVVRDERPRSFLARIAGSPVAGAYGWVRLASSTGGSNLPDGFGTSGTATSLPAYEVTGSTSVPDGATVLMWPADSGDEMRFIASGTGNLYVFTVTDGGSISSTSKATFPSTSLTDNLDGTVTLNVADATHAGLVSLSAQVMGAGDKTFQNGVVTNSTQSTSQRSGLVCHVNPSGNILAASFETAVEWLDSVSAPTLTAAMRWDPVAKNFDLSFYNAGVSQAGGWGSNATEFKIGSGRYSVGTNAGVTGTGGGGDAFFGGICTSLGTGGNLTVGTSTITSGTSGNYVYDNGGVVGERTPAATDANLGTAAGAIADGTYGG